MTVIDVDDEATWTADIRARVSCWADRYRGTTEYANDLPLRLEAEAGFRELFRGRRLRVYHCTKLLPHEVLTIQEQGLRPLSADLLQERISAAREFGALSNLEADQLLAGHVFARNEHQYREKQICFILSKRVLRYQRHGCEPLLTTWGGEGVYAASGTQGLRKRLLSIGTPTVIQARIDLFSDGEHHFFSALHKTFVGVALGLDNAGSDVFYRAAVPAGDIERFIHAGDAEFEALGL